MTAHGGDRVEKDVCKLVRVRRFLLRYSLLSLHCRTGIMRQPIQIFTYKRIYRRYLPEGERVILTMVTLRRYTLLFVSPFDSASVMFYFLIFICFDQ